MLGMHGWILWRKYCFRNQIRYHLLALVQVPSTKKYSKSRERNVTLQPAPSGKTTFFTETGFYRGTNLSERTSAKVSLTHLKIKRSSIPTDKHELSHMQNLK